MSKRRRTLKKYGKTIAKLRKEKGLTQEQLGKKTEHILSSDIKMGK